MANHQKPAKGFQKGNAGKPKGAVNKTTQEARELFISTLENQVQHINAAFDQVREIDSVKYLELFVKYAQYFVPKKVDFTTEGEQVKQVFKIGNVEIEL